MTKYEIIHDWQPIETAPKDGTIILGYYYVTGSEMTDRDVAPIRYLKGVNYWVLDNAYMVIPIKWMPYNHDALASSDTLEAYTFVSKIYLDLVDDYYCR